MGLTNTVVFIGKDLEDDVLVLSIRGVFRWIACAETVPEAIHVVQIVVGVLAGAHPRACHPDLLYPNDRPQNSRRVSREGMLKPVVRVLLSQPVFALELPNHGERRPAVVKKSTLYKS